MESAQQNLNGQVKNEEVNGKRLLNPDFHATTTGIKPINLKVPH